MHPKRRALFISYILYTKSQLQQDLFVLSELNSNRGGFFVEIGASDGIKYSNTHFLEKKLGWNGIVAEPAKCYTEALKRNRNCFVSTKCVWSHSGQKLEFSEARDANLSTLTSLVDSDLRSKKRNESTKYTVETITLNDLLNSYSGLPPRIEYLSLDTEGSEYDILSTLDFDRYNIKIITCEHNYTDSREKIYKLLLSKGYARKYSKMTRFDDWYVKID